MGLQNNRTRTHTRINTHIHIHTQSHPRDHQQQQQQQQGGLWGLKFKKCDMQSRLLTGRRAIPFSVRRPALAGASRGGVANRLPQKYMQSSSYPANKAADARARNQKKTHMHLAPLPQVCAEVDAG